MNPSKTDSSESVLREWRTRTLNIFTILVAVAAAPAWVMTIVSFIQNPDVSGTILPFTVLYALIVVLAVFRRIDYRLRAWGLLLVGYVAAITNLVIGGLRGASPWYLLVLPIIGFILVSVRSGIVLSILSALVLATFIPLFESGILTPIDYGSLTPWSSYATFVMLLAMVAALMALFQHFQMTILERERRAHEELPPGAGAAGGAEPHPGAERAERAPRSCSRAIRSSPHCTASPRLPMQRTTCRNFMHRCTASSAS